MSELTQLDTAPSTPATTPERETPPSLGSTSRRHRGRRNSNLPSLGSSSRCCRDMGDDDDIHHDDDTDNHHAYNDAYDNDGDSDQDNDDVSGK